MTRARHPLRGAAASPPPPRPMRWRRPIGAARPSTAKAPWPPTRCSSPRSPSRPAPAWTRRTASCAIRSGGVTTTPARRSRSRGGARRSSRGGSAPTPGPAVLPTPSPARPPPRPRGAGSRPQGDRLRLEDRRPLPRVHRGRPPRGPSGRRLPPRLPPGVRARRGPGPPAHGRVVPVARSAVAHQVRARAGLTGPTPTRPHALASSWGRPMRGPSGPGPGSPGRS